MNVFDILPNIKVKISCLILLCSVFIQSQNKINIGSQVIERFVDEQGFNQNTVNSIKLDNYGDLWIGTPNGLVKYDGYSFKYFYHKTEDEGSIPNNYIANLLNDSQGRLWIDTREGVSLYLPNKEQFLLVNSSVKEGVFIKEDSQNRIWIGNDSKLLIYKSNPNNEDVVSHVGEIKLGQELGGNAIVDIEFLSESELLVATHFDIYRLTLNENDFRFFKFNKIELDFKNTRINKIVKSKNLIWIATDSGLYQTFYQNNKITTIQSFLNSSTNTFDKTYDVLSLFFDNDNNLWIGTRDNGVLKYNQKDLEFMSYQYNSKNTKGLSSNRVNCFYEDEFGVIWIGTGQGGLNKLNKNQKPFHNYSHNPYDSNSLSSNLITDIVEAQDGRIWVSFFDSTICISEQKLNFETSKQLSFEALEEQLGRLKDEWVLRLFQDQKGYWWIGTNKGIYLFDEENNKLINVQIKNEEERTKKLSFYRVITQTDPNHILLAGAEVLLLENPWDNILNNKEITVNSPLFRLEGNYGIKDYAKDSYGNYWFASSNGVYRVVDENGVYSIKNHFTRRSINDELILSHNNVFSILIGRDKSVWLGSFGGGLMRVQLDNNGVPKIIEEFHKKDGLPDEVIYGILEDKEGDLWLSTDMGISHFDIKNKKFNSYDVSDGVSSNNFRQSSYLKTSSGIMLMGSVKGLTAFDPKQIERNTIPPQILISRLKINNSPIVTGAEYDKRVILEKPIAETESLTLDYYNRNISLDLIVQHNSVPQKNKLLYKLEGINNDWIEISAGKTTATYTNLDYGTYKFFYKGANGDGVWTSKTHELQIIVLAPWYLKWWSVTFFVLVVLAIVYAVFRYLVRLEKLKHQLRFEKIDKERAREMNQAKLQFFTNISHDFKTPLSLIIGPLEKIAEQAKQGENEKYFSIIHNNISRLQRLIDQLITYRKAETGHMALKYVEISVGDFMYPLVEAFEEYASHSGINFYYKINSANRLVIIDVDKIERVLLNLFSNAIKYGGVNAEISIEAGYRYKGNTEVFYIEVSDTGIGIEPENIKRIFDRFYRGTDYKGNWSGTGIGLALSSTLIDLMKGKITVESDPGVKTTFTVTLSLQENLNVEVKENVNTIKRVITDWLPTQLESIQEIQIDDERPSLLIVDDELEIISFLTESLKGKYNIRTANNGEEALQKIKDKLPNLVISDVMMPKMDGYELCERIKSNLETCHIPIIIITVMGDEEKKIKGFELGADVYITKPFSIKHLEIRIKRLLENKQRVFDYFSRNSAIPKKDTTIKIPERDKEFLEKVNSSIEENMSNSAFGVEELGTILAMSTSSFFRRLKALTGQAPSVYLRNFRLQKAADLLKADPNLNANEVMFEIGIESASYYSTSFKKLHGYSPSEFVKKMNTQ